MLANLKNLFKVPELRNKILFTLMCVAIYRCGTAIRVPWIDNEAVAQLRSVAKSQGALGFLKKRTSQK